MSPCLCLLCFFAAAEAPKAPAAAQSLNARVEAALEEHADLLACHRGYLAYLQQHPAMNNAEEAWQELSVLQQVSTVAEAFDEALRKDIRAQTLFDQYYDQLARDESLRAAVDTLQRAEFAQGKLRPPADAGVTLPEDFFGSAMTYLRAHPDTAMRFLQNPQAVKPAPEALYPLLGHFQDHPELLQELLGGFQRLTQNPQAYNRVFPWWNQAPAFDQAAAGAYTRLYAHLKDHPNRFWIWHQRNIALAGDAQARDWIRYWCRTFHRTPVLHADYLRYLQNCRKDSKTVKESEQRWEEQLGPVPEWPPKLAPPIIPDDLLPVAAKPAVPTPTSPQKPTITKPQTPRPPKPAKPAITRPTMPTKPTKPVAQKPEKP